MVLTVPRWLLVTLLRIGYWLQLRMMRREARRMLARHGS